MKGPILMDDVYDGETYDAPRQAGQVVALAAKVPTQRTAATAFDHAIQDLNYTRDARPTTAILGRKYLCPVLVDGGRVDLACELLMRPSYPGHGYMLGHGATTLWEL